MDFALPMVSQYIEGIFFHFSNFSTVLILDGDRLFQDVDFLGWAYNTVFGILDLELVMNG